LELLETIVQSLQEELRPRKPVPAGTLTGLQGLLKTPGKSLTDAEVEGMKAESLLEKYHQMRFADGQ